MCVQHVANSCPLPPPHMKSEIISNSTFFATVAIFLIKSNLGSWWTLKFTGLCILRLLHIVSSWFKEDLLWRSKAIINHQVHNIIICYKLENWLITVTQACFWKWQSIWLKWEWLLSFFPHDAWLSISVAFSYW